MNHLAAAVFVDMIESGLRQDTVNRHMPALSAAGGNLRQVPFEPVRHTPDENYRKEPRQDRRVPLYSALQAKCHHKRACDGRAGIDIPCQNDRHLICQQISQHASSNSGHDPQKCQQEHALVLADG